MVYTSKITEGVCYYRRYCQGKLLVDDGPL